MRYSVTRSFHDPGVKVDNMAQSRLDQVVGTMLLDSSKLPEIHRLLAAGNSAAVAKLQGTTVSLTTLLHLALAHRQALNAGNTDLANALAALKLHGLDECIQRLDSTGEQISTTPFGSPRFDCYRIGSKADLLSPEWVLFYDRFRRSAAGGTNSPMFRLVGGVLGEMGDNVVWHAFEAEDRPCPALAAFHVSGDTAAFCVSDAGQGFLQSLRRDPRWRALSNSDAALDAVVNKHATSRADEAEGGGFKQLFKSLLDFNGIVILRTGSCCYRLENSHEVRNLTIRESLPIIGSYVTVIVSKAGVPVEIPLDSFT